MQDRFKFRVWNKKTKKMYEVRSISEYKGDVVRTVVEEYDENGTYSLKIFDDYECMSEACEFMQCTGLKDKYGKLIYEGDIVKFKFGNEYRNGKVEYSQTIWSISNAEFVNRDYVGGALINLYRDCEVIGNIYENKEFLEGINV